MHRIITLFAIIFLINGIDCISFNDCGSSTGKLTSITVSNCPPSSQACDFKAGTNVSVDIQFLSETNSDTATVKLWGIIGGVPVPFPLNPSNACGNWNINCPLVSGNSYELKITMPISTRYPKIKLDVRLALLDSNNNKLVCQQFPVQID